ncbi:hypothetical protein A6A05_11105 [Magnetospirillum moscoviense]|uniref:Uncharacterized protein n=1 Tax=Magnetospirillum moscoviense TaxID=1437059 RepID=A0A178MR08_9PROT|nr:hypothetical protein A6A05_11105 [Magnetospirillum moscoviense]
MVVPFRLLSWVMVAHLPGFSGRPGWVRCSGSKAAEFVRPQRVNTPSRRCWRHFATEDEYGA